jgi:hypothetical protein
MESYKCSILSIAPYRVLPPKTGGHLGIVYPHHYLGQLCEDHVVSTSDNEANEQYAFHLHAIMPPKPARYIPYSQAGKFESIIKSFNTEYILCDHPYMALDAISLSKKYKIPWFLRSHNIESDRFRDFGKSWWRILHYYEGYAMRKANGVFFVTQEDAEWAIKHYHIDSLKAHVAPFGTTFQSAPVVDKHVKQNLAKELNIDASIPWLYFLGALDYRPNAEAVGYILDYIVPLLTQAGLKYQILIAGKGLSEVLKNRIDQTHNIKYTGFIPDLDVFLKACDIMLNPILSGGGIKTKAVEALAYNKHVVSTYSGATGLIRAACGTNLQVATDNNWEEFAQHVLSCISRSRDIPEQFYQEYYWGNIAKNMLDTMEKG